MDNDTFSKISRLHFGMNIVSPFMKPDLLKCSKCGTTMDCKGRHALVCKMSKNPTYRHDTVNKFICELIQEETSNYHYEPTKLDETNKTRADIIVYDEFEQMNDTSNRFLKI